MLDVHLTHSRFLSKDHYEVPQRKEILEKKWEALHTPPLKHTFQGAEGEV